MVVPLHEPERYCEEEHLALEHEVQAPLVVEDDPFRYSPEEHVGWLLQMYRLVVPLHEPVRYCDDPQLMLAHVLHW